MRNAFGGLSFNLTRVAAEGAPGTSSHDCYDHSGGRRGNLNLVPRISNQRVQSPTMAPCVCPLVCLLCVCERACVCACTFCSLGCFASRSWLLLARSATPLCFPGEGSRFLLRCNIWFITIRNSTSVRLSCLKKILPVSQRAKGWREWGRNPLKRRRLEIDSCYCACAICRVCQGTEKG